MSVSVDLKGSGINFKLLKEFEIEIKKAHKKLYDRTGEGSDFLGWVDWPIRYDKQEFERIINTSEVIRKKCQVFLVVGIGGSYLGSKAALEAIKGNFYNQMIKDTPDIFFVGNNISSRYLMDILEIIKDKEICVNVISKSGTTTEPAIAFRIIKRMMEEKYGREESARRIFATTDKSRGALLDLAKKENYETFVIGDDIGGRFSVITPVGLLPMSVAGIDIKKFMLGAASGYEKYKTPNIDDNPCFKYVAYRNIMYSKGKKIEILANYEPALSNFSEWWKQLFGESEGKDHRGLYPSSVNFTSDLHSMGQYIQDGERHLFETVIRIADQNHKIIMPKDENDLDGLNYLSGKSLEDINEKALEGTFLAHVGGGVPNCIITVDTLDSFTLGSLMYFFMVSCGISGYLLGINPFNQPGVEAYKQNMFALLGKQGYEELHEKLLS
ncbi:MAG: Glucose-6-phosphate isomerase [Clostridiales bacterium 38_11]|nr:MAG: Glucose-6-phosphate isomerase [Clostridiales bacterium 38_11]HBH13156.1 glucose-6-phosphate isomerase [Clostridiales bacterium]